MATINPTKPRCSVDGCEKTAHARGWCYAHYQAWKRKGDPLVRRKVKYVRGDAIALFWERVNKDGPIPAVCPELGPCWLWTGPKTVMHYGCIRVRKKTRYAHVVSWFLATGEWPGALDTLHRCDNPPCVNPSHLFLGTHADNMTDMVVKKRSACGERHRLAKLTKEQVLEIRAADLANVTPLELAARYGVARRTIYGILSRTIWRHI